MHCMRSGRRGARMLGAWIVSTHAPLPRKGNTTLFWLWHVMLCLYELSHNTLALRLNKTPYVGFEGAWK
jgi:hypothetical protein